MGGRLIGWAAPALAAVLALATALPAGAQSARDRADPDTLRQLHDRLDDARREERVAAERADAVAAELTELRARSVTLAKEMTKTRTELFALEASLDEVTLDILTRRDRLAREQTRIHQMLGALVRLARTPPIAFLSRPQSPGDASRSAALLATVLPALRQRASDLADRLHQFQTTRRTLEETYQDLTAARDRLEDQTGALETVIKRREALYADLTEARDGLAAETAALAKRAADLEDLLYALSYARREKPPVPGRSAPGAATPATPATTAPTAPRVLPPPVVAPAGPPTQRARPTPAGAAGPSPPIPAPRPRTTGGYRLPVTGTVTTGFGQTDRYGNRSRGVRLTTAPGALVVAPDDGTVMFAGPFRGYGQLLIVEHTNGYHSLIAGLGRIDTDLRRRVSAGEPLGVTPTDLGAAELYYELRANGRPIDPQTQLQAQRTKDRG